MQISHSNFFQKIVVTCSLIYFSFFWELIHCFKHWKWINPTEPLHLQANIKGSNSLFSSKPQQILQRTGVGLSPSQLRESAVFTSTASLNWSLKESSPVYVKLKVLACYLNLNPLILKLTRPSLMISNTWSLYIPLYSSGSVPVFRERTTSHSPYFVRKSSLISALPAATVLISKLSIEVLRVIIYLPDLIFSTSIRSSKF